MKTQNSEIDIFSSSEKFLALFQQYKDKIIGGEDIVNLYDKFFLYNKDYADLHILISSYQDFTGEYLEKDYLKLQRKVIDKIEAKREDNFTFFELFSCIISKLFDQTQLQIKFLPKIIENQYNPDFFFLHRNYSLFDNYYSCFSVKFDYKFNFYLNKSYNNNIEKELIKQEHYIYHINFTNDYQSFIVHANNESHHHFNDISISIPFYPYSLSQFNHEKEEKHDLLSKSDKFVMIKEIAIGMNQLHEHQIFNIGLNENSIYINNDKDSYIGHFIFKSKVESELTFMPSSFYYRHPDINTDKLRIIESNDTDDIDEKTKAPEEYIKYDIFSFGILVFSIFSDKRIISLMRNMHRYRRIDIMRNNYKEFLLSSLDFKNDEDLNRIKKFIGKCMDAVNSDSYSNFNEVIEDIDFIISYLPQKMKQEIDDRINNAADSNTYEFNLSNLIENYYEGNPKLEIIINDLILFFLEGDDQAQDKKRDYISQILRLL